MTTLSISPPFPIFSDRDGSPLENGYVWIGTVNLNPVSYTHLTLPTKA